MTRSPSAKVVAILPAFNAEKTLIPFLKTLPKNRFAQIILVDDFSLDQTYKLAKTQKNLISFQNPHNLGYGGNLKVLLNKALDLKADIIVELHPDAEYDPQTAIPAIQAIKKGAKLVLGNRFAKSVDARNSGLYPYKYPFIKALNQIDNLILGTNIPDLHQGFRVYTKQLLENINFLKNGNDFIFSFEIIAQAHSKGLKITSLPVKTNYTGPKRGVHPHQAIIYTLKTFPVLFFYLLTKIGIKVANFK